MANNVHVAKGPVSDFGPDNGVGVYLRLSLDPRLCLDLNDSAPLPEE